MPILLTRSRYLRKQLEQSKARVVQLEGALTAAGVPIPDPPAQGGGRGGAHQIRSSCVRLLWGDWEFPDCVAPALATEMRRATAWRRPRPALLARTVTAPQRRYV
eukprot:COSAG01_NODE_7358_length_3237_cov_8.000000_3_plen_105_part_00